MVPWAHAQYREVRVSRRDVGVEMQIDFTPVDVDTGAIKFRDRHREKQRQRRLKRDQEAMEVCRPGRTCSTDGCCDVLRACFPTGQGSCKTRPGRKAPQTSRQTRASTFCPRRCRRCHRLPVRVPASLRFASGSTRASTRRSWLSGRSWPRRSSWPGACERGR